MASLAFQDEFTKERGVTFFVSVEPVFSEQIAEAVTFIARARPENVRVSYISQFSAAAKLAAPVAEVDDAPESESGSDKDADAVEDKKVEEDTDEVRDAKRKVFRDMIASVKGLRIDGPDREYEGYSNLLLSLLLALFPSTHPDFPTLVLALVDSATLSQDRATSPTLAARYTALATLFNALPVPTPASPVAASLRLSVLLKLVAYAAANDDFAVIRPALARFEQWLLEWGYGPGTSGEEEGNAAVLHVVTALAAKGQQVEARSLLLQHLAQPSAVAQTSASPSSSAAALATQVIVLSLALPDVFDVSALSALPAVAAPSVPALKELLDIFHSGDVAAFEQFATSKAAVLAEHKLDPAVLERKLKLLALAELCSKRVGELVPYAEIAGALRLASSATDDGEEVETWVIDAIRASLISGRLSQPLLSFHVTRAAPRSFTPSHWTQLQGRLEGWRTSLDAILDSVSKGLHLDGPGAHELRDASHQQSITV